MRQTTSIPPAIACVLGCVPLFCMSAGVAADRPPALPQQGTDLLALTKVKEPSGICHHVIRNTLFLVDDSGKVCEFTPDGTILHRRAIRKDDFEGITHDPSTGLLYVAIEGAESILEIDPETLEPMREFPIPRTFEGKTVMKKGGQGIEGITFVPDRNHPHGGTFFVANQGPGVEKKPKDASALFELEVPLRAGTDSAATVKILGRFTPRETDISGLHYDGEHGLLYAISDTANTLMAYTRNGECLRIWALPGNDQEGITLNADGVLFVAQDSGGVLSCVLDWERMRE